MSRPLQKFHPYWVSQVSSKRLPTMLSVRSCEFRSAIRPLIFNSAGPFHVSWHHPSEANICGPQPPPDLLLWWGMAGFMIYLSLRGLLVERPAYSYIAEGNADLVSIELKGAYLKRSIFRHKRRYEDTMAPHTMG